MGEPPETTMPEPNLCPRCGSPVTPSAPFGLCPRCLVGTAITGGAPPAEAPAATGGDERLELRKVGCYQLLEKLGEGATGDVFAAQQREPVERKVAIKILKRGVQSEQVAARFEAERQALALMAHRNVATVFDGGQTEDGRPYFAMEFVDGEPVTSFCTGRGLGLEERLALFVDICEGVTHAHGRGIIHRDLKPGNILVESGDGGAPIVKVIDFGIAKAAEHLLTTRTVFTELGRPLGTPAYMSPEQASGSGEDVDVRTDVYSLGVLLYELLAGTPPFVDHELRRAGAVEMSRILNEEIPQTPSARITAARDSGEPGATGIEPRAVDSDLDWIVMCALEKDRERRYASVADFARDVRRFLDGDAIEARPPSKLYHLGKWARKHRLPLLASAAVFVALAAGIVVSTQQRFRATRAERAAEERAEMSKALNDFFEDDLIAAALEDGFMTFESAVEIMAHLEGQVEVRLTQYPLAEAGARLAIARTLLGAGLGVEAKNPLIAR